MNSKIIIPLFFSFSFMISCEKKPAPMPPPIAQKECAPPQVNQNDETQQAQLKANIEQAKKELEAALSAADQSIVEAKKTATKEFELAQKTAAKAQKKIKQANDMLKKLKEEPDRVQKIKEEKIKREWEKIQELVQAAIEEVNKKSDNLEHQQEKLATKLRDDINSNIAKYNEEALNETKTILLPKGSENSNLNEINLFGSNIEKAPVSLTLVPGDQDAQNEFCALVATNFYYLPIDGKPVVSTEQNKAEDMRVLYDKLNKPTTCSFVLNIGKAKANFTKTFDRAK
jgi:coenzyme F420-reducing hydrogenase delta subunit